MQNIGLLANQSWWMHANIVFTEEHFIVFEYRIGFVLQIFWSKYIIGCSFNYIHNWHGEKMWVLWCRPFNTSIDRWLIIAKHLTIVWFELFLLAFFCCYFVVQPLRSPIWFLIGVSNTVSTLPKVPPNGECVFTLKAQLFCFSSIFVCHLTFSPCHGICHSNDSFFPNYQRIQLDTSMYTHIYLYVKRHIHFALLMVVVVFIDQMLLIYSKTLTIPWHQTTPIDLYRQHGKWIRNKIEQITFG